jgi:hypothetical protein
MEDHHAFSDIEEGIFSLMHCHSCIMYGESSAGCELIKLHDLLDGSMGGHVAYLLARRHAEVRPRKQMKKEFSRDACLTFAKTKYISGRYFNLS